MRKNKPFSPQNQPPRIVLRVTHFGTVRQTRSDGLPPLRKQTEKDSGGPWVGVPTSEPPFCPTPPWCHLPLLVPWRVGSTPDFLFVCFLPNHPVGFFSKGTRTQAGPPCLDLTLLGIFKKVPPSPRGRGRGGVVWLRQRERVSRALGTQNPPGDSAGKLII